MQPISSTTFTHDKKSYTLEIHHDESPSNPFEDDDGNPPLLYRSLNHYQSETTHYGTENLAQALLDTISDHKLVRLWKQIDTINPNILDLIDFTENKKPYNYTKAEYMREQILHGNELTELESLQLICDLTKTPHLSALSRSYSQGDYADVLIVLSPEYIERSWIIPKNYNDILTSTKTLFDAYIWWDMYGFTLTEHKPLFQSDGTLSDMIDDDIIDSCWWFYGDDHETNGILDTLPDFAKPYLNTLT